MNGSDSASDRGEERTNDAESADGSVAGAAAAALSRRRFLRASAAATAAGVGLGASGAASAEKVDEVCNSEYGTIGLEDNWVLMDNRWGLPDAQQCIWLNDDGSFGYDFDASGMDPSAINYPEVYCGTRPWGSDTGVAEFPLRRSDVNELVLEVDADINISGGEWDWAEEWWLLDGEPNAENPPHTHEIMMVLDWGGGHDHGSPVQRNAWQDQFGNTIDHWAHYPGGGGTEAGFHIFRVQGGMQSGKVDLGEVVDYLTQNYGVREDLTISGIELGNEYWGGASGEVTYHDCQVHVNGSTYAAVSDGGGSDTTAPSRPSNVSVTGTSESSVTVTWNAASDSGGSGLAEYVVSAGGSETTVSAGTTQATVDGLQSDTQYEVSVVAVDGAGNESGAGTASARTDGGSTPPQSTVSVDLSSTTVSAGGQSTASIVLSEAPGGVSGFDLTVSVADSSVATIESAAVGSDLSSIGGEPSPSGGGSSATISGADLSQSVSAGATDVELATVTLAGQSSGETDVSVEVSNLDANDGSDVPVSTRSATLTVGTDGPSWPQGATDPDGDGHYEDLNGNGDVDYDDVVEYFNNMESSGMESNVDYYDYNGNGDIDFADVVELFKQV